MTEETTGLHQAIKFSHSQCVNRQKKQPAQREKVCISHSSENCLIVKIHKEVIQLNIKKINHQIKKCQGT